MQQNNDLRSRLSRIHESSDLSDLSETVSLAIQKVKKVLIRHLTTEFSILPLQSNLIAA